MDVIARYTLVVVSGVLFAFGPIWSHVSCLVLFLCAANISVKHRPGLCFSYYAMALCPLLTIAYDYSLSFGYSLLAYSVLLVVNAGAVSLALMLPAHYRGLAVASVIVILSVPPLAVLSPVSPIPVAGTLFPGMGTFGILLFIFLVALCATGIKPTVAMIGMMVFYLSHAHANTEVSPNQVIVGINTNRGAPTSLEKAAFVHLYRNEERDSALAAEADIVVFPESTFGQWHDSYRDILSVGSTRILGGARHYVGEGRYVNVLMDGATGSIIYAQQTPVPVLVSGRDKAVSGQGISASDEFSVIICNEIANAWIAFRTFGQAKNDTVIWVANLGWTENEYVVTRTKLNAKHWSKLYGVSVIEAVNYHA